MKRIPADNTSLRDDEEQPRKSHVHHWEGEAIAGICQPMESIAAITKAHVRGHEDGHETMTRIKDHARDSTLQAITEF